VKSIEKNLPDESRPLWEKRANVDYIVLMGWQSSLANLVPGNVINSLKDALFKVNSSSLRQ
jgi:hypothetical protein